MYHSSIASVDAAIAAMRFVAFHAAAFRRIFFSGLPAVCTGANLTIAKKIPNNTATPASYFPQLAHFVEDRHPIARNIIELDEPQSDRQNGEMRKAGIFSTEN